MGLLVYADVFAKMLISLISLTCYVHFCIFVHSFKGYLSIFAWSLSPPNFTASNSVVTLTAALETKLKVMFLDFFFWGEGGGRGMSICVCVCVCMGLLWFSQGSH